jgi:FkbM family methyltransferase
MNPNVKNGIRRTVRALHLMPLAHRAQAVASPHVRRTNRDDRHLRVALAATLRADSDCIDIGANAGVVTSIMNELAPEGRVIAVEPLPEMAEKIRRELPNVQVLQMALSSEKGTAQFKRAVGDEGFSRLADVDLPTGMHASEFSVEVQTLDAVLPADFTPRFIKIDVEGVEMEVLRGAADTLAVHHPALWVEHGRTTNGYHGANSHDLWDLLCRDHGYRIFDADGMGPIDRADFWPTGGPMMWNWLAV